MSTSPFSQLQLSSGRLSRDRADEEAVAAGAMSAAPHEAAMPASTGLHVAHVLVPLDGSQVSEGVLPFAVRTVAATGARLTLLRVIEAPPRPGEAIDALDWEMQRLTARASLQRVADGLADEVTIASVELAQGRPAEQILAFVRDHCVDLVLLSTHGEAGLSGWSLGSTTDKILRRSSASVMVIPAWADRMSSPDAALVRRILVPLDTSPRAECALPFAVRLARHHDAEIVLAHVVLESALPRHAPPSAEDRALAERLTARNHEEAGRYLETLRERTAARGARVRTRVRVAGRCGPVLREIADEEDIDLVVLCAHGHAASHAEAQGDLPARLVRDLGRPVLIVQDMPAAAATSAARAAGEQSGH